MSRDRFLGAGVVAPGSAEPAPAEPTRAEIDAVARLLSEKYFDGCENEGWIEPCMYPPCQCRAAARGLLIVAQKAKWGGK